MSDGHEDDSAATHADLGPIEPVEKRSAAAQRSMLWGTFAEALAYPNNELVVAIRRRAVASSLRQLLDETDLRLPSIADWRALEDAGIGDDDLAVEHTRLFDTGANRSACPLYGGLHVGPQMKTMEEAVRFYNLFGLTVAEDMRETPDHLITELEFLHFLAYGEAERTSRGEDAAAYERAQRDFIARHPGRWIPRACRQLAAVNPMRYYAELFRLLDECLKADLDRLQLKHGPASLAPGGSQMP